MPSKTWRLGSPAQPLLFCYPQVSALCAALAELYGRFPAMGACLCLYRGEYFLALHASLSLRGPVLAIAGKYGAYLGPSPVLYSFFAEHGRELSRNALQDLGALLR